MDSMYKESGKLCAHYGCTAIGEHYQTNDGSHSSRYGKRRLQLKTSPKQLTVEEKSSDIWNLAEKDARKTSPLSANTFVVITEKWLPLASSLTSGPTIHLYTNFIVSL